MVWHYKVTSKPAYGTVLGVIYACSLPTLGMYCRYCTYLRYCTYGRGGSMKKNSNKDTAHTCHRGHQHD